MTVQQASAVLIGLSLSGVGPPTPLDAAMDDDPVPVLNGLSSGSSSAEDASMEDASSLDWEEKYLPVGLLLLALS